MKRCPECDFLYEDDQRLCDMDGMALVHDARAFLESSPANHTPRHLWQRLAIALPLTVLAGLAFYVLQHQPKQQTMHPAAVIAPSETDSTTTPATPEARPAETESKPVEKAPTDAKEPEARKSSPPRSPRSADPATKSTEKPLKPAPLPGKKVSAVNSPPNANKDSKIASFLKKTGRILKKPFKL